MENERNMVITNQGKFPIMPVLKVQRLHEDAVLPTYASEGDSGMDLYATEDMFIKPGEIKLVKTGLRMEIPRHPLHDVGYRWEAQIRPRSGVSLKTKLRVGNAPGTIDNFYRGDIGVIVHNSGDYLMTLDKEDSIICAEYSNYALNLKGERVLLDPLEGEFGEIPEGTYMVRKGDRVAQIVFVEVIRPLAVVEGEVSTDTSRGSGGFGSTGV